MRKKALAILLCLTMVLGLAPAMSVSYADTYQAAQTASSFDKLKSLLEADGDANIMLTGDILTSERPYTPPRYAGQELTEEELLVIYVTLGKGKKTVDLNGHKLEWNFGEKYAYHHYYLFYLPSGAELTMKDSSGKNAGTIETSCTFKGLGRDRKYENEDVSFGNLFYVAGGKLDIKGGNYVCGRAKESWAFCVANFADWKKADINSAYGYTGYVWQQMNGECVFLESGSLSIEDGILNARGYRTLHTEGPVGSPKLYIERAAAVRALSGSVDISGGEFYGRGGANALDIADKVSISVSAGVFSTNSYGKLMVPRNWFAGQYKAWRLMIEESRQYSDKNGPNAMAGAGKIGLPEKALDMDKGAAGTLSLTKDGKELAFGQWMGRNIDGTTEAASITVSEKEKKVYYPVATQSSSKSSITSVRINGSIERGGTLSSDMLSSDTKGVDSVYTSFFCNGSPVSSGQPVGMGSYELLCVLHASEGYSFSLSTSFTIMGEKTDKFEISADGATAIVESREYSFDCDHSKNKDSAWKSDADGHYRLCTVCGERYGESRHSFGAGEVFGSSTTYTCTVCGFSRTEENGREGVNGMGVNIPVALIGGEIEAPEISDGFKTYGKIVSSEWRKGSESGSAVNPGGSFESGTYFLNVKIAANEGYYFKNNAVMSLNTGTRASMSATENELNASFRIVPTDYAEVTISLPALAPGKTIEEYLNGVLAYVGEEESTNLQASVYPGAGEDYGFVKKNYGQDAWSYAGGSLSGILGTKILPDTEYIVSISASTNNSYVPDESIYFGSASSCSGYKTYGGEAWASVDATLMSESSRISSIDLIDVSAPVRGESMDTGFGLMDEAGLEIVSGSWSPAANSFAPETAYTFTGKLKLAADYSFASSMKATVNGKPANISVSGSTATVSYTFPKTESAIALVSGGGASVSGENPFVDVADNAYYHDAVLWAYYADPQVTNGIDATHFGPMNTVTRGQAMTFLWRAAGCPKPTSSANPFADVAETAYYRDAVLWAVELGITNGTDASHFSPNQTCSRGHIITFLYRLAGSPGVAAGGGEKWYTAAMNWAESEGLTQNLGSGAVVATDNCPRADVVCYLYRQLAK